ncbi:hypothetical protein [Nonomuraea sp. WAC 01424]|uniref:hypothetical protein n=1 Tax=Nonomuraea sp. WAC 01424 TaxID=2203200 RepID=UPI000F798454|nr:hypothetical protein [Nonomuraea sp. WAC 01424]
MTIRLNAKMINRSEIEFSYGPPKNGWAVVTVGQGDRQTRMVVSYLTDALGDLLRSLVEVTQGHDSRFSWDSEPTEYRWIFTREDDALKVRILSFYNRMRPEPLESWLRDH